MNEVYPLERAAEAYDHMMSGKAKFRCVLAPGDQSGQVYYLNILWGQISGSSYRYTYYNGRQDFVT